jgi:DNA-binding HxlR family transcriptional regulator
MADADDCGNALEVLSEGWTAVAIYFLRRGDLRRATLAARIAELLAAGAQAEAQEEGR